MSTDLDAIDRKILDELVNDARIPIAVLASKVHLSRHAVRHRIDRLEANKVIQGYTIRMDDRTNNKPLVRAIIMVYRKDRMRGAEVTATISGIPEVTSCSVLSGDFDLILHVDATSQERVSEIWSQLARLPGVTDTHTTFILSDVVSRR